MSKLTYNNVLIAAALLGALPLDVKVKEKEAEYTRSLDGKLTGRVVALLANLNRHVKDYSELEAQARKTVVPEDFQKKYEEYRQKLEADKEKAQPDPVLEKDCAGYDHKFLAALTEIREQEVEVAQPLFSAEEFEAISAHTQGAEIKINGQEVPRLHWLMDFSQMLVEA